MWGTEQQRDRQQRRERKLNTGKGREDRYLFFPHCITEPNRFHSANSLIIKPMIRFLSRLWVHVLVGGNLLPGGEMRWEGGERESWATDLSWMSPSPSWLMEKEERKKRKEEKGKIKISHELVTERKKDVWGGSNALLKANSFNKVFSEKQENHCEKWNTVLYSHNQSPYRCPYTVYIDKKHLTENTRLSLL